MRNNIFGITAAALLAVLGSGVGVAHACDRDNCREQLGGCVLGIDCVQVVDLCDPGDPGCGPRAS
jgi:hypothetical protein